MKKWNLKTLSEPKGSNASNKFSISDEIGQILISRGITSEENLEMYVKPNIQNLRNPFLLKDMDKAVARIEEAIKRNEKIVIYGDYDVDGVSSTSILLIYFKHINYEVEYYIPNRLEEGYGLNKDAIDHIKDNMNGQLIITVDCGITSVDEVDYAKKSNIDVIISDHHEPQEKLPNAIAVVDPKRSDCSYPFKGICGCGVAFKLIHALSGDDDFYENINLYLEIVALATVCDIMPVLDENRIIVKNGMEIMGKGANKGMQALIKVCGIDNEKMKSSHLGFAIGPRINASGRLGFSSLGVELFTETNAIRAMEIAELMNSKNEERQNIEALIYNEVESKLDSDIKYKEDKVLVLSGRGWHHGIIGIVASKITEKYYKPAILLCSDEDGIAVGSARSIKGFDIFSALCKCSDLMTKFGGHEQAAGMTMDESKVEILRQRINEIADFKLNEGDLIENIKAEYVINPQKIDLEFVENLHILEPFGIKNPTPYFVMQECLLKSAYYIGRDKKHIKLVIDKEKEFDCVGFGLAHLMSDFEVGDLVDLVFSIDKNTYMGNTKVQLMIKDIRLNRSSNIKTNSDALKSVHNIFRARLEEELDFRFEKLENFKVFEENKDIDYCDLLSRTRKRKKNILELYCEKTLVIYNTYEGYSRAKSDIGLLDYENIEYICLSNVEKYDIKVYNKIIIYDYFNNFYEIAYLFSEVQDKSMLIMNFENKDFIYLRKNLRALEFDRNEFVVIYKYLMGINEGKITYSNLLKSNNFSPFKLLMILETLENAGILSYKIDYDNDLLDFNFLPKPSKKLSLEDNPIIIKFNNIIKKFNETYS